MDHVFHDRMREASQTATETMTLVESLGDENLTVGLSFASSYAKMECGEWHDVLRWSQEVIDLADGDPSKGDLLLGSPLAGAFTMRAIAGYWLGLAGWVDDMHRGLTVAASADPVTYTAIVGIGYGWGLALGALKCDDRAIREIEDAVRIAERSGDDLALSNARISLALALVYGQSAAEWDRGKHLLAEVSEVVLHRGTNLSDLPFINAYLAGDRVRCGDRDALPLVRGYVDHLFRDGRLLMWGVPATGVLVESLLAGGTDANVFEAESAIQRLATVPCGPGYAMKEVWLVRLRALVAHTRGDDAAYREFLDRYRELATSLSYEGHMKWAEAMP